MKKIAILGASRGLGKALSLSIASHTNDSNLLLISRKEDLLQKMSARIEHETKNISQTYKADFANNKSQDECLEKLKDFDPNVIFYFAAGGPFGTFKEKNLKDHHWALEVSFVFPAKLLHFSLNNLSNKSLKQICFIGSAVCESNPDPHGSMYCASKHALKGLISSVQKEEGYLDIRLYSPSYMDTDLLPKNSWPRTSKKIFDPALVAEHLRKWSEDEKNFMNCFIEETR